MYPGIDEQNALALLLIGLIWEPRYVGDLSFITHAIISVSLVTVR